VSEDIKTDVVMRLYTTVYELDGALMVVESEQNKGIFRDALDADLRQARALIDRAMRTLYGELLI
jgi:hypothetical protein